jgi:hypothetical protein
VGIRPSPQLRVKRTHEVLAPEIILDEVMAGECQSLTSDRALSDSDLLDGKPDVQVPCDYLEHARSVEGRKASRRRACIDRCPRHRPLHRMRRPRLNCTRASPGRLKRRSLLPRSRRRPLLIRPG